MAAWPLGLRFQPTEDELVDHHLRGKLEGKLEAFCLIPELYIYKHEPPDLFITYNELSDIPSDRRECFFYCPRKGKIPSSHRSNNRMTELGYWKDTCRNRTIRCPDTGKQIGIKKILVYYEGRQPKGRKTDIVMHEYHLKSKVSDSKISGLMAFVLCHIFERKHKKARSAKASILASLSAGSTPNDFGNGRAHKISEQASEEVTIETENQNEMSISSMPGGNRLFSSSLSTGSTPNDSGNGRAHKISAQASEEVMIEIENQNEMSISSMPGGNQLFSSSLSTVRTPNDSGNGRARKISAQGSEEVMMETENQNEMSISSMPDGNRLFSSSLSTGSTPNDSGNGRAHEISAWVSEGVAIESEDQYEMSISCMPDGNVPIITQQAQMNEEQSSLNNGYQFTEGCSDKCYAMPYSPSDCMEILDLWNVSSGQISTPNDLSYRDI